MELETKDPNPPAVGGQQQMPTAYPQEQPLAYPSQAPPAYSTLHQPYGPGQPVVVTHPGVPQPSAPDGPTVTLPPPEGTTYVTVPMQMFPSEPRIMQCTSCGKNITTEIQKENGDAVWVMVIWICLVTVWCCLWPLAFIPCCIPSLKDTVHSCPECKCTLGKHSPGGAGNL
ncbi:lipopolysaccharide-induced tumor necrosis factor-alpha factor homolog isoform X2 [Acanthaster planci]|uniref:Lipopolysaccharide-induced tumor necrosis factor-alpha factor homolog isoform X2 n=1 Tax=Acanthaster planci TaxID=133434 RepID=A0A8B7YJ27_ACAPL|nr:lipopolysaccharide-induced tumor necrosis factor-alpha factor homolog isoform X2 [Acanthaster planci]XP_022092620.1 lipopolysaccharide-induced tumor necrosis factor-alpha factor homolog isoform X2 [Acanthaster planci]XP_022092621.1 lipopolysaccharide-induced tumor necrosis factor-alpha factor homolog isoform X2 [Acanthaster planci]XP_022092622.1 lipopolysaccharide-induced tumor necrosis factor-alpha factor homolog isoform X2 [Acanthaster planci]XP_022092623.1 lipopolysaccharide-induced tumor